RKGLAFEAQAQRFAHHAARTVRPYGVACFQSAIVRPYRHCMPVLLNRENRGAKADLGLRLLLQQGEEQPRELPLLALQPVRMRGMPLEEGEVELGALAAR